MPQILLVDDDRELCAMLARYLTTEGFLCQAAYSGPEALTLALAHPFDALVLDVMLPGMDGFALLRRLREKVATPVLMLTARGEDVNSILGLESGADDYLTKPCNPKVLVARLRAVLRRANPVHQGAEELAASLQVGDVILHPGARAVYLAGRLLELTGAEFNLLYLLLLEAGQVVTKETLFFKGLGRRLTNYDRSIDIHISNLRRKLGRLADGGQRIVTVRNAGYLYALPRQE